MYQNPFNIDQRINTDLDLPDPPSLEICKETFGGFENIIKQGYKENRGSPCYSSYHIYIACSFTNCNKKAEDLLAQIL